MILRVLTLVEATLALAVGALGGAGLLYGTGDLKSAGQIERLQRDYDDAFRLELSRLETQRAARLEEARAEQERAAAAEKARLAELDRKRVEALQREQELAKEKNRLPAFGLLVLKAASDLEVDTGAGLERGKSIDVPWETPPVKFKVKGGKFTISLTPKLKGNRLTVDVAVSPMAIIVADGERKGVSTAQGLVVGKSLKLDFQSPAAGDLNLVLQFRK